jgi:hypothetical protein
MIFTSSASGSTGPREADGLSRTAGRGWHETNRCREESLINTLLDEVLTEAQGSLTAPEIAAILDECELPVTDETESSVGPK